MSMCSCCFLLVVSVDVDKILVETGITFFSDGRNALVNTHVVVYICCAIICAEFVPSIPGIYSSIFDNSYMFMPVVFLCGVAIGLVVDCIRQHCAWRKQR